MSDEPIRTELSDGVAVATIDAPPINLMDGGLLAALDALGQSVASDPAVRVLVLRSANPDFFVAHGDVATIESVPLAAAPAQPPGELPWVHQCIDRFRTMPKVTIAQVEGFARGGGSELTLACDMRFAALGKAVFGQPEIGLGILPGAGGTARLTRLVGRARACEIILGGDDFDAAEAERIGWLNRALPPDAIGAYVDALARRIARFPATPIAEIKGVMQAVEHETGAQLRREQWGFDRCMAEPGSRTLMQRWVERGFQTPEGEREIGARLAELADG